MRRSPTAHRSAKLHWGTLVRSVGSGLTDCVC